jgi:NADH-quinone oxidoreductase subunit A
MDASAPVAAAAQTATPLAGPTTFDVVYPFTILLVLALSIPAALLGINFVLAKLAIGSRNNSPGKLTQVESGIANNIGTAEEKFSIKFYLVAMLFLAFDIEVAFLYPWAIQFNQGGWGMVAVLAVFLVILEVGYLYLYRKGAFDWDK